MPMYLVLSLSNQFVECISKVLETYLTKKTRLSKCLFFFSRGVFLYALPEFIQNIAKFVLVCHKIFYA